MISTIAIMNWSWVCKHTNSKAIEADKVVYVFRVKACVFNEGECSYSSFSPVFLNAVLYLLAAFTSVL